MLYMLFQTGEIMSDGTPLVVTVNSTFPSVATIVYSSPGRKRVNFTISDQPIGVETGIDGRIYYIATNSDGTQAPTVTTDIVVESHVLQGISNAEKVFSGSDVDVYINAVFPPLPDVTSASVMLSKAFESVGDYPTLVTDNSTHQYTYPASYRMDATKQAWKVSVSAKTFNSTFPVLGTVSSLGSQPYECSIASTDFDMGVPWLNSLNIGYDMGAQNASGIYPGIDLRINGHKPARFYYASDRCSMKQTIVTIGAQAQPTTIDGSTVNSRNYHGGLFLISSDGLKDNIKLRDPLRDPAGQRFGVNSLCYNLSDAMCRELEVLRAIPVDRYIIFLTTAGVFRSSPYSTLRSSPMDSEFVRITTGVPELDTPPVANTYDMVGYSDCFSVTGGHIFVFYSPNGTASTGHTHVAVASTALHEAGMPWAVYNTSGVPGATASTSFLTAMRDFDGGRNYFVVGTPNPSSPLCATVRCPVTDARILELADGQATFKVYFEFPPSEPLMGLQIHANDLDIYAFGRSVWHSVDGGETFQPEDNARADSVGGADVGSSEEELFVEFASTRNLDAYVLKTSELRILYGRTTSVDSVWVNTFNLKGAKTLSTMKFDAVGNLYLLSLDAGDYTRPAAAYPTGLLHSVAGDLRNASDPYLRRWMAPIASVISTYDDTFPADLALVFMSKSTVRFYARSRNVSDSTIQFSYFNKHSRLSQESTLIEQTPGSAVLTYVSDDGTMAEGVIINAFVPDTKTQSPMLEHDVAIIASNATAAAADTWNPEDFIVNYLPATLVLQGSVTPATGWRLMDVGKTVVTGFGSILLSGMENYTHMQASIVKLPTFGSTYSSAGDWQLFDLRGAHELAESVSQTLSISAPDASNIVVVTLSPGAGAFDKYWDGNFIQAGSGVAQILSVRDANTLTARVYSAFSGSTYGDGGWSVFRVNSKYESPGEPREQHKTRPWRLAVDTCAWTGLSSSTDASIEYVGFNETYELLGAIAVDTGKPYEMVQSTRLGVVFSNPWFFGASVNALGTASIYATGVNISLRDTGVEGETIISYRPSPSTLMCNDAKSIRVIFGCPPTRYMMWDYLGVSKEEFLYGNPTFLDGVPLLQELPANYRPPSPLGKAVPTTENIYNAAPDQEMYNNRYGVSKRTGTYKQCAGKPTAAACGCTDDDRFSVSTNTTDCQTKVLKVLYQDRFIPEFFIHQHSRESVANPYKYRLREVNNRTDYCVSSAASGGCGSAKELRAAVVDPARRDYITWSGAELYHFRAETVDAGYCKLAAEFIVYVVNDPPRTSTTLTVMALTAVVFGLGMLSVYLLYAFNASRGW